MGLITSRFRENKSTIEVLETIDKDISRLQKSRRQNQELQKRVAASLLLYSIIVYIALAVLFYLLYFPKQWQQRLLYSLPFLVFPFLIWGARKLLHWYFFKRLTSYDLAVNELREKKKLILEDVMEKETYKKAKEILEKFDPARFKKLEKAESPVTPVATPGTHVRQRMVVQPMSPRMMNSPPAPRPAMVPPTPQQWTNRSQAGPPNRGTSPMPTPRPPIPFNYSPPPGPPMPRTVLPKDRGKVDRFIDYLVGDGPQNRFALICNVCLSHNGMALPEEFEYLSFRCCYCYNLNRAKKMRPFAPRLEFPEIPTPNKTANADSSDTDTETAQSSGTEAESKEDTKSQEDTAKTDDKASSSEEHRSQTNRKPEANQNQKANSKDAPEAVASAQVAGHN